MPDMEIAQESSGGLTPGLVTADTSNVLPGTPGEKPTEDQIVASMPHTEDVETEEVEETLPEDEENVEEVSETTEETSEEEEEVIPLSEEDLSVAKIQQFSKDIPELKAAFDKNPAVRNAIFAMARRSARLSEYQTAFPTVEAAKFAAENSESFMALNDLYFSEKPEDVTGFWNQLWDNSLLRDPQTGQLVLDKRTNQPISTGAYERVASAYRNALYSTILADARNITDPDVAKQVREAVALVREAAGDGRRQSQQEEPQLNEEQKRKLAEADELKNRFAQQQDERVHEFQQGVLTNIVSTVKDDITAQLKRVVDTQSVALTPYEQKKVADDIFTEIDRLANQNRQYQLHFDNLLKRAPLTEAGKKSLVAEARRFAKEVLPTVMQKVIREATNSTVEKAAVKVAKRADQTSRREVKTSGGAPRPTHQDLKTKAAVKAKELKRQLTEDEIMAL